MKKDNFANNFYFKYKINYSNNRIITSDRIPKSGIMVIDNRYFNRLEIKYNTDNVVDELFISEFNGLGYIYDIELEKNKC